MIDQALNSDEQTWLLHGSWRKPVDDRVSRDMETRGLAFIEAEYDDGTALWVATLEALELLNDVLEARAVSIF